jgi:hypothetical protein
MNASMRRHAQLEYKHARSLLEALDSPFRRPADGPAGLMLALNTDMITCITSVWDKKLAQNVLHIHLVNTKYIKIYEDDVPGVLETLGLGEFVDDWTLNLMKDLD